MTWLNNDRGASLIAAIFIIVVLAFMGVMFLSLVNTGSLTAVNDLQSGQALSIAEGGIERAVYRLNNGTSCNSVYPANLNEANVLLGQGDFDIVGTNHTLSTVLSAGINNAVTIIPVASVVNFAPVGRIMIESEIIDYSGIAGNTFINAVRGVDGTTAVAHAINTSTAQDQCRIVSTGNPAVGSAQRVVERTLQNPGAMIVYAKAAGVNVPYFRRWDGTRWGPERPATALGAGVTIQYLVLKFARTRNEAILGTLDNSGDIRVQVWDGNTNSWSATTLVGSTNAGNSIYRGFDIEYETSGDRAIIVYNDAGNPMYRIWDGSSWSVATLITMPGISAPTYQAAGAAVTGTGAVSPVWPAHAINDIALLFVESAGGEPATLSTPAGFAPVLNSPKATGVGTAGTQITVFWARATSTTMAAPTVADPGDHVYARIITYRGVITAGDPWDVTGGGVKTPASTSVTVTGVTTSVPNTLIVQAVARDNLSVAAAFSAQTNVNLTGITERSDAGTISGNGGGFGVWDGVKATAGATGDTTATVTSSINAFLTIALKPATGVPIWIELAPNPLINGINPSEIVMIKLDSNADVYGMRWPGGGAAGTAWSNMSVPGIWDNNAATANSKVIDVAYEQLTGHAMFIWGDSVATDHYFRIWDGATLLPVNLLDIAAMGGVANWVRLVPRPNSNQLMYGVQDSARDLNTRVWSGVVWDGNPPHAEHTGNTETTASRNFDIVFETYPATAGNAWLMWGGRTAPRGGKIQMWDGTTNTWGATITSFGDRTALVQLAAHPNSGAVFAGIYQDPGSATLDITELHLTNGGAVWPAETIIWNGGTVSPAYERVFIAYERYIPNIIWREIVN